MDTRFHERFHRERPPRPQSVAEEGEPLGRIRAQAEQHLAAGDEAIEKALSGDSEAFLAATRQQGGE